MFARSVCSNVITQNYVWLWKYSKKDTSSKQYCLTSCLTLSVPSISFNPFYASFRYSGLDVVAVASIIILLLVGVHPVFRVDVNAFIIEVGVNLLVVLVGRVFSFTVWGIGVVISRDIGIYDVSRSCLVVNGKSKYELMLFLVCTNSSVYQECLQWWDNRKSRLALKKSKDITKASACNFMYQSKLRTQWITFCFKNKTQLAI